ncbi:hypothetical protein Gohar_019016, partial [Gossypium harknessii]|nr:hypothetical protein [Gossypium harknessii]
KATAALSKLWGRAPGDEASENDILISLQTTYMDKEAEVNFLEIFHGPSLKAFIIDGGLVLFQESARFSVAADATHFSIAVCLFKLLLTWIAVAKVVDIGRRPLLMGGFPWKFLFAIMNLVALQALSLFLLSAYYQFLGEYHFVVVAALLLYVGCYQAVLTNFGSNVILTFAFSPLELVDSFKVALLPFFMLSIKLQCLRFRQELLGEENIFLLFRGIAFVRGTLRPINKNV